MPNVNYLSFTIFVRIHGCGMMSRLVVHFFMRENCSFPLVQLSLVFSLRAGEHDLPLLCFPNASYNDRTLYHNLYNCNINWIHAIRFNHNQIFNDIATVFQGSYNILQLNQSVHSFHMMAHFFFLLLFA